jgi:hypothetical protein
MTGTVVTLIDKSQRKDAVKIKKGAGVEVEIGEPDVASLPEGPQQAFRPKTGRNKARVKDLTPPVPANSPSRSKARSKAVAVERKERTQRDWDEPKPRGPRTGSGTRTDDRSGARPSDLSRNASRGAARPGRSERQGQTDHGSPRSSRPEDRSERSERQARWANEDASTKSSRENRADRRNRQFTEAERTARAEANEREEARRNKQRANDRSNHRAKSTRTDSSSDRTLPGDVPGASKVRPSGASRRKAKREVLAASGEEIPRAKKRRSGKPRPPAASKRR